jgi:hypothetical protein
MARRRIYRLSGPVIVIGFLFFLPALLGIAVGGFGLAFTAHTTQGVGTVVQQRIRTDLEDKHIPNQIIIRVIEERTLTDDDLSSLSGEQRALVKSTEAGLMGARIGMAGAGFLSGGIFGGIFLAGLAFGLLGLLLTMRKSVLKCGSCGLVENA